MNAYVTVTVETGGAVQAIIFCRKEGMTVTSVEGNVIAGFINDVKIPDLEKHGYLVEITVPPPDATE